MRSFFKQNKILLAIAVISFIVIFGFSLLTVYNYSCEMEDNYITGCNTEIISELSSSISYGKDLYKNYSADLLLDKAQTILGGDMILILYDDEMNALTSTAEENVYDIPENDYRCISQEIKDSEGRTAGWLYTYYPVSHIWQGIRIHALSAFAAGILIMALSIAVFACLQIKGLCPQKKALLVIIAGVILQGLICTVVYSGIFYDSAKQDIAGTAAYLEASIESIIEKGADIDEISDLDTYFAEEAEKYSWISRIYLSDAGPADTGGVYSAHIDGSSLDIYLCIEEGYIAGKIASMLLSFFAAVILAVILMIESIPVADLITFRKHRYFNTRCSEQFRYAASELRLTNFVTSTLSYMCLSFSALQIKEWDQSAFGLSPGMAAAMSISMCTVAEAVGMVLVPVVFRRMQAGRLMLLSSALLIISNMACFFTDSAAMIIVLRTLAGLGFAGNKQVNNEFITSCYDTEEEKQANLTESNAGIIGGILCGMGLGSVISGIFGYAATFMCTGAGFVIYVIINLCFTPWKLIDGAKKEKEEESNLQIIRRLGSVLVSPGAWNAVLLTITPQYIFLMVIVSLIPGRVQSAGLSVNVLTYCNLVTGLCGLYIGSKLGSFMTARIGNTKSMGLIFLAGAGSMIIIDLPCQTLMLLISSIVMGLIDGAGTPLATGLFLENRDISTRIDEASALMYYTLTGYVVMSVAPVILELCEKNFYVMAGTCLALAAAAFFTTRMKEDAV